MYYYKLQVLVLTADTALTDTVKKLEPLAGFEYEVLCRQNFDVAVKNCTNAMTLKSQGSLFETGIY